MAKQEIAENTRYFNLKKRARKLFPLIVGDVWEATIKTFNTSNGVVTKQNHSIEILSTPSQGLVSILRNGKKETNSVSDVQISILKQKAKKV